jgi:hypothetical protein
VRREARSASSQSGLHEVGIAVHGVDTDGDAKCMYRFLSH